jgi:hypothetical protein
MVMLALNLQVDEQTHRLVLRQIKLDSGDFREVIQDNFLTRHQ